MSLEAGPGIPILANLKSLSGLTMPLETEGGQRIKLQHEAGHWIKPEPEVGGWIKPEPEVGGWIKPEAERQYKLPVQVGKACYSPGLREEYKELKNEEEEELDNQLICSRCQKPFRSGLELVTVL